jgi:hypothetical protein
MKRPRPYIPLAVRVEVARRQCAAAGVMPGSNSVLFPYSTPKLETYLLVLFGDSPVHLDHYPALILRDFNERTGKYNPDANDPEFLVYRTVEDHRTKTFVRGERGQLSDTILRAKNKSIARNRDPNRKKTKINSRNFFKKPLTPREMFPKSLATIEAVLNEVTSKRKRAWPKRFFPKRKKES